MKTLYENIIFCWVMHEQDIIDQLLSGLNLAGCEVKAISLICEEEALVRRLKKDIALGIRKEDVVERSVGRISLYGKLRTVKVDVSEISAEEAAGRIMGI